MKSVIMKKNDAYKDWGLDVDYKILFEKDENVIALRQMKVDSLEIKDGFPKAMRDHCTFSKEDYISKREAEKETNKDFQIIPDEAILFQFIFKEGTRN
jgi:hypothetical protein